MASAFREFISLFRCDSSISESTKYSQYPPLTHFATPLISLIAQNNTKATLLFIKKHPELCFPDETDENGNTALMISMINQNIPIASTLLNAFGDQCNIRQFNFENKCFFHFLEIPAFIPVFEIAARKCLSTYWPDFTDENGNTHLLILAGWLLETTTEFAITLIQKFQIRCLPGARNSDGETVLMVACSNKNEKLAFELVNWFGEECKPELADHDGRTALWWACNYNLTKLILRMIGEFEEKCNLHQLNKTHDSALSLAISHNNFEVVFELAKLFATLRLAESEGDFDSSSASNSIRTDHSGLYLKNVLDSQQFEVLVLEESSGEDGGRSE